MEDKFTVRYLMLDGGSWQVCSGVGDGAGFSDVTDPWTRRFTIGGYCHHQWGSGRYDGRWLRQLDLLKLLGHQVN